MSKVSISNGKQTYSEIMNDEEIEQYSVEECRKLDAFPMSDVYKYNGNHFVYGWWESFMQSDDVPMWIYAAEIDPDSLIMTVE
jgi:hypothetical protein